MGAQFAGQARGGGCICLPRRSKSRVDTQTLLLRVLENMALVAIVIFATAPLGWMVISSLRPAQELFTAPPRLFPQHVTIEWYREAFERSDARQWFLNSFVVASLTMVLNGAIGCLGAYSITRFRYPGRHIFQTALLSSYVLPPILLLVPLYMILRLLHLVGSLFGLVLAHLAMTLPFSVWLIRSFLLSIPLELEQAALCDGCSELGAFRRITLPLAKAGIVATSLFAYVLSWNEYLFASVLTQGSTKTLPAGIAQFVTSFDIRWGAIMAMGTFAALPIFLMFACLQGYFEKGILAGGVKG
jgi:multiple sugar transport system permease protein